MSKTKLESSVTIDGHTFEFSNNDDCKFYECRGEIMYDDEHDQTPEPSLWRAAHILADRIEADGYEAQVEHSEKGWVEVNIF
jgi:hypothetical protein